MIDIERRARAAGYGELWDNYRLCSGIVHLRLPVFLTHPSVITPESSEPASGSSAWYRLTTAQHRDLLLAMFGDDPGLT